MPSKATKERQTFEFSISIRGLGIEYKEEHKRALVSLAGSTLALWAPGNFKRFSFGERIRLRRFLEGVYDIGSKEALEIIDSLEARRTSLLRRLAK